MAIQALIPYALAAYGGYRGYRSSKDQGITGINRLLNTALGAYTGYSLGTTGLNTFGSPETVAKFQASQPAFLQSKFFPQVKTPTPVNTTHTSIKLNNKEHAKWKWLQAKRKEKPNMSEEALNVAYAEYIKGQTGDNNDDAVLVADHSSYAGNYTCEVHGDDCKQIDGDYVRTIDGDYHLKVTGDCHIEVGGGFFLDAEGAPKVVDKHGNKKNEKVQKHTIKFGSDVDMSVVGAKFELQGAEANIASTSTKITGSIFENSSTQQTCSAGEMILSADNSITIATTTLFETINFPPSPIPKIKAGIIRKIGGSCETVMTPAGSAADAIPRYIVANPAGPISVTSGATGYNNNVLTGLYNVNVAAGAITMNSSTATSIIAGGAMNLTASAVMKLTAASIFLN